MRFCCTFLLCLCLASCDGNRYGDHPPCPTKGRLLVNGAPAGGAKVRFFHDGDWGEKSIVPQGFTDDDGQFVLSTYGKDDGAPAGDYRVTVEWYAYRTRKESPDKLTGAFAKPDTSGLTAHVDKGDNDLLIEVKGKVTEFKAPK